MSANGPSGQQDPSGEQRPHGQNLRYPAVPSGSMPFPQAPQGTLVPRIPDGSTRPSPVFVGLLALTALAGWACWSEPFSTETSRRNNVYAVLAFVLLGWIVSLCLHEFAHARTAYWAGDTNVAARGYLTLNPLSYVNPGLSLLLPLVFLLMGGIGLPGGAVWIRTDLIRTPGQRSLVSAAGPASNLVLGALLAVIVRAGSGGFIPTMFDGDASTVSHEFFWGALSFLALLQFIAAFLNLVPIPGLDGFGIIEPHLPAGVLRTIAPYRGYSIMLLFFLAWRSPWFADLVFGNARHAIDALGVPRFEIDGADVSLADYGQAMFHEAIPSLDNAGRT